MLLMLLSCLSAEKVTSSAEVLPEDYFDAICQLYVLPDCVSAFAECSSPVSVYTGWDDCMNDFQERYGSCGILPLLFEENEGIVQMCLEKLRSAECTRQDICPEESIVRTDECGEVSEILTNNCSIF